MANDVTNIIKFENISQSQVTRIMEKIKNEEAGIGSIDFNKIIPMPDEVYRGEIDGKAYQKYGENNWHYWSTRNWGTITNAYNFSKQYMTDAAISERISAEGKKDPLVIEMKESLKEDGKDISYSEAKEVLENEICFGEVENIKDTNKIIFCTAWSTPDPVLEKLSEMFPEALITHQWADEDLGYNVGTREYENGQIIYENLPDGGTKESYEMAEEIMGINLQDAGLKLSPETNTYKYVEEAETKTEEEVKAKIKVVLVKPMIEAKIVEIDSGLKSMQETVGGLIECIQPFEDEVALICNEEGKINGLDFNRALTDEDGNIVDIIAGDFFVCAARSDDENFSSLTDEEATKYCEKFKSPELFFKSIAGVTSLKLSERKAPEMER